MGNLYSSRAHMGADAPAMMTVNPQLEAIRQRDADAATRQRHALEAVAAVGIGAAILTVGLPVLGIILIIKAIKK